MASSSSSTDATAGKATQLFPVHVGRVDPAAKATQVLTVHVGSIDPDEAMLAPPLPCDTLLRKGLQPKLTAIKSLIGIQQYNEVIMHLEHSHELAKESLVEAAKALTAITLPGQLTLEQKADMKAARKVLRDVIFWKGVGVVLGLDERKVLMAYFQYAKEQAQGGTEFMSQLTQTCGKILDQLGTHEQTDYFYNYYNSYTPSAPAQFPFVPPAGQDDALTTQLTEVYVKILKRLGQEKHAKSVVTTVARARDTCSRPPPGLEQVSPYIPSDISAAQLPEGNNKERGSYVHQEKEIAHAVCSAKKKQRAMNAEILKYRLKCKELQVKIALYKRQAKSNKADGTTLVKQSFASESDAMMSVSIGDKVIIGLQAEGWTYGEKITITTTKGWFPTWCVE